MLKHNLDTLNALLKYTDRNENCCVVNPCGSGKTSVMSEFIRKNKNKKTIVVTKQKNAADYYRTRDKIFISENVKIVTYTKMWEDIKKGRISLYRCDYLILDEAHYMGAVKWQQAVQLIKSENNPVIIGFTATPQRFKQQGTGNTIVTDFFNGNSVGNLTSKQLADKGVFTEPDYFLSMYNLSSTIANYLDRINDSDLSDEDKEKAVQKLEWVKQDWIKTACPAIVLKQQLPKYMYQESCNRILVYTSDLSDLEIKKKYIDDCITAIFPEKKVKSYTYTYKTEESELKKFLRSDKNCYIKVLYSVDKIMETIHIDDLRILIALRPSISERIISQQFGRLNSISNSNKPVIFDMVNNMDHLIRIKKASEGIAPGPGPALDEHNKSLAELKHNRLLKELQKLQKCYIIKYANVFATLDVALARTKRYTYGGYTEIPKNLATIFNKKRNQVLENLKTMSIKDAIEKADNVDMEITSAIIDLYNDDLPEFTLTDAERDYAQEHMDMVENICQRKKITDADLKQDFYMWYLYLVHRYSCYANIVWKYNQFIYNGLLRRYYQLMKYKELHDQLCVIENFKFPRFNNLEYWVDKNDCCTRIHERIQSVLRPAERKVIRMRFGFYGEPMTYLHVGTHMGVTKERIRQIEYKALRKLIRCDGYQSLNGFQDIIS